MPIHIEKEILFIHIPKTGGSSVEKALGLHPHQVLDAYDFLSGTGKHLQHLTYSEIKLRVDTQILERMNMFCIVRNPIERFYFEYHWRLKIKHKVVENLSIEEFAQYLLQLKKNNKLSQECHYRLQSDYFYEKESVHKDIKIFRLEDGMQNVEDWLNVLLDEKIKIKHDNKTKKGTKPSSSLHSLIKDIYLEDFIKLGYGL